MNDYGLKNNNLKWLWDRTILLAKAGSHSYGLAGPGSDLDIRGVAIAPKEYYLGFNHRFEQAEQKGDPDVVVFEIRKFFNLAAACNPNVLEQLFVDESDIVKTTPQADLLRANRDLFLTKRAKHTFGGYAYGQLNRIKGHRSWLINPPKAPPTRAEFGLGEDAAINKTRRDVASAAIRKKMESWEVDMTELSEASKIHLQEQIAATMAEQSVLKSDLFVLAGKAIGLSDVFIEILEKEHSFANAQNHWRQYQDWKTHRNPKRAAMEAKFGFDLKHAMHLCRLLRMGHEILSGKGCLVRRPDWEELLAIKYGAMSYDELIEYASKMSADMNLLYDASTLPKSPDMAKLDKLCVDLVESFNV